MCAWNGTERRHYPISDRRAPEFYDQGVISEQLKNITGRIRSLEDKNFVPFANYKWVIGTIVTIFLSLFSIAIYNSHETTLALQDIRSAQKTTIVEIKYIHKEIENLQKKGVP